MIVVNGDSFVQEAHLSDSDKWSTRIGADINLAMGAGSNDRIFYTTIEQLNDQNCDVLVIGWTSWLRSCLTKANGSRFRICHGKAFDETPNSLGEFEEDKAIADTYYRKLFNEFTQLKHTLLYMLHLQEYCKMKNIKMLNFATVFDQTDLDDYQLERIATTAMMSRTTRDIEQAGIRHNKAILKKYISRLDPANWVDKTVFSSMRNTLDHFPKTEDYHVGAEGSKHWAGIIKQHLATKD